MRIISLLFALRGKQAQYILSNAAAAISKAINFAKFYSRIFRINNSFTDNNVKNDVVYAFFSP